eukprot:TRINITY_DN9419_c0_g1_i20.p1 TRINITY_DN9419_c0_g1~~TRINITY_DN9419_c0_g1_i20.p1  ORF type:complete len:118 (+),score=26.49 TRINITY_DN9419_c0_g1_i20:65-418(+)
MCIRDSLWTILPKNQAEEIIAKLGIEKYFRLVLTREDSLEDCEGPLKDYSALADEPHKVIFIDEDAAPYVLNPGNLIQLPAGYPIEKLPGRLQDLVQGGQASPSVDVRRLLANKKFV